MHTTTAQHKRFVRGRNRSKAASRRRYHCRPEVERLEDRWVLALSAFEILSPTGTVDTGSPEITWQGASEALHYDVVVSPHADLSSPVQTYEDVVGTSVTLNSPLADGTYYLGVTAERANTAPEVYAGGDVTTQEGSWFIGAGSFSDPANTREAENQGLSFTVAAEPEYWHRMFVTSGNYTIDISQSFPPPGFSTFGGAMAADWQVTYRAFSHRLFPGWENWDGETPIYRALLSSPTENARDRISVQGDVLNLAGEVVASSAAELWSAALQNSVTYDDYGSPVPAINRVWTGSFASGVYSGNSCGDWNQQTGYGLSGDANKVSSGWMSVENINCAGSARLYAISPLLGHAPTVAAGGDATVTQGQAFSRTVTIDDLGDRYWTATVDYGDGGGPQTWNGSDSGAVPTGEGSSAFDLNHTYDTTGAYTVTVTVNDSDLSGPAVATFQVEVQAEYPGPFAITGPLSPVSTQTPTVTWEVSAGATQYDVVVSAFADLSSPLQVYDNLTGTSQVLTTLSDGTYYVGVTAENAFGHATPASNEGYAFEVAAVPEYWHRMFVTSTIYSIDTTQSFPPSSLGEFGGAMAADWQCTYSAFRRQLFPGWENWDGETIVYRALLSSPTENARDRISVEGDIINMAGDIVASSSAELWSAALQNSVTYDDYGSPVPAINRVWTGSFASGVYSGNSCGDWSQQIGYGLSGDANEMSSGWMSIQNIDCAGSARLYAISPPLVLLSTSVVGPGAPAATLLTEAELGLAVEQAIGYWAAQGLDPAALPLAGELHVGISDLPGTELSNQLVDLGSIALDRDAAGYGWTTTGPEAERVDLATTMIHELGHYLGLSHADASVYDVMTDVLEPGEQAPSVTSWLASVGGGWTATVDYGDGDGPVPLSLNADNSYGLSHRYLDNGNYPVTVSITDPEGLTATDSFTVTVENVAPLAMLDSDAPVNEGSPVTLSLTEESDPSPVDLAEGLHYNFALDPSQLATSYLAATDGASRQYTFGDNGSFSVYARIFDKDDGYREYETTVLVRNVPPTLEDTSFELAENQPEGTYVGTMTASDPGDDSLSYAITGGSGEGVFVIDPATGVITVYDASRLDYESTLGFDLTVTVSDGEETDEAQVEVYLLNQPSITGTVFVDANGNRLFEADELGLDSVVIELLDGLGQPVLDDNGQPVTATTADGGLYLFDDLDPGTYWLREVQPSGVLQGWELLGTLGGEYVTDNVMQLVLERTDAHDYVFAELGSQVTSGDTATIGFWQNRNGQDLITQGGSRLADWLTVNFRNIFGDEFVGASGSDVASFYKQELFRQKSNHTAGPAKVDAQFMALTLATYFTSRNYAGGDFASHFGFNVSDTGIGSRVVNVGTSGAAFGVADYSERSIMQLLVATNSMTLRPSSVSGFVSIYDTNGDGVIDAHEAMLRTMANSLFSWINEAGD